MPHRRRLLSPVLSTMGRDGAISIRPPTLRRYHALKPYFQSQNASVRHGRGYGALLAI